MESLKDYVREKIERILEYLIQYKYTEFLILYTKAYEILEQQEKIKLLENISCCIKARIQFKHYYNLVLHNKIIEEVDDLLMFEKIGFKVLILTQDIEDRKTLSLMMFERKEKKYNEELINYNNIIYTELLKIKLKLAEEKKDDLICSIGLEPIKKICITPCLHLFDEENLMHIQNAICPLCRRPLNGIYNENGYVNYWD